ncbi:MAG TPA: hypothetical protein VL202_05760 [Pararhizobium sp.]|uniref:hypothetical protein n=1 Tax=Pararhizobium sp. TaxID=1977563 RepID=UPI002CD0214E|nr:hypothetical protein [Pararhizobium sp.]HTO30666.1 hypothetical protein [Pararhizobium sp.]
MAGYVDERGDRVSTSDTNRKVSVTGVEARQGFLGRPVLMVLIGGLLLAAIAWAGAEMFGEATDNDAATQTQQVAPAEDQAAPANQGTVNNTPTNGAQMQTAPADHDPTPQTGTDR